MWTRIKTILLVAIVTGLVWVWAEGESLTEDRISVTIEFSADPLSDLLIVPRTAEEPAGAGGTPSPAAALASRSSFVAVIDLEGSTDVVTRAQSELDRSVIRLGIGMAGMPRQPGGDLPINLLDAIRGHADFRRYQSAVISVDPPSVVIDVVRMVTRQVPVRAIIPAGIETDGEATPASATVSLRMPESLTAKLLADEPVRLFIDESSVPRLRELGTLALTSKLRLPASIESDPLAALATIRPDSLGVTVRLRQRVDEITLRTVPVWVNLPPTELSKWNVELQDEFLSDVTLSGPAEVISRIRAGELSIKAGVELSWEELERGVKSKTAGFAGLPPGVTATVENAVVRIRIAKRSAAGESSRPEPAAIPDEQDTVGQGENP